MPQRLRILLIAMASLPLALYADVTVKIDAPVPHIVLPAPPPMVWLPKIAVYVAHGSPHPIFFHHNHYYLHHHGVWYLGPGYGGPWIHVKVKDLPPGLYKFRDDDWRGYQREAAERRHDRRTFFAQKENRGRAYGHDKDDDDKHPGRRGKGEKEGRGHKGGKGRD